MKKNLKPLAWFLLLLWLGVGGSCQPVLPLSSQPITAVRILVSKSGMVKIDSKDLKEIGLNTDSAKQFRLSLRGKEIPFWYEQTGDAFQLHFWGQAGLPSTSLTNVYLLSVGEKSTAQDVILPDVDASLPFSDFALVSMDWQQNNIFSPLAASEDPWFWEMLRAPEQKTIEVTIDQLPKSGEGLIELSLWSPTSNPNTDIDHQLLLQINDHVFSAESWRGAGEHAAQFQIPFGVLQPGVNRISISLPGIETVDAEITYLNKIVLQYATQLVALNEQLVFESTANVQYRLEGFSSPLVWIYDLSATPPVAWITSTVMGQATFSAKSGHAYAVVGSLSHNTLKTIEPAHSLELPNEMVDYLVVGSSALQETYRPIIETRQRQGWKVWSVDWMSVCNQYNDGFVEPQAIQKFLRIGIEQGWVSPDSQVVLLGDATYFPAVQSRGGQGFIPTFFVKTLNGGLSPSDVLMTDLDGDQRPELALGRIPSSNPSDLSALVQKMLDYEKHPQQPSIFVVADGQEVQFQDSANLFLKQVPSSFEKELYTPPPGMIGANTIIQQQFNQGRSLIVYFGHGSLKMWGKDRIFTIQDVEKLSNQSYPIVMQMTCLSGFFVHPEIVSLSEKMLWQPNGGAIAAISPTGLTFPNDQRLLGEAFVQHSLTFNSSTIGSSLLKAWQSLPNTPGTREVLLTFLLLGDPTLKIATIP